MLLYIIKPFFALTRDKINCKSDSDLGKICVHKGLALLVMLILVACTGPGEQTSLPQNAKVRAPSTVETLSPRPATVDSGQTTPSPEVPEQTAATPSPAPDPTVDPVVNQAQFEEQRQIAIQECYSYARALVTRDRKIDRDAAISIGGSHTYSTPSYGGSGLVPRMRAYGNEKELQQLYAACMQAKGYSVE